MCRGVGWSIGNDADMCVHGGHRAVSWLDWHRQEPPSWLSRHGKAKQGSETHCSYCWDPHTSYAASSTRSNGWGWGGSCYPHCLPPPAACTGKQLYPTPRDNPNKVQGLDTQKLAAVAAVAGGRWGMVSGGGLPPWPSCNCHHSPQATSLHQRVGSMGSPRGGGSQAVAAG